MRVFAPACCGALAADLKLCRPPTCSEVDCVLASPPFCWHTGFTALQARVEARNHFCRGRRREVWAVPQYRQCSALCCLLRFVHACMLVFFCPVCTNRQMLQDCTQLCLVAAFLWFVYAHWGVSV